MAEPLAEFQPVPAGRSQQNLFLLTTDVLRDLVRRSALPLAAIETDFAVDSTGLGLWQYYRHFTAKYGRERTGRDWLKLHATIGVKTNVITACEITHKDTHDGALLRGMIADTAENFTVREVSADKAYSIKTNLKMLESIGAKAYIPFKSNTNGNTDSLTWNRLFHYFNLHREAFMARYHPRSNAESTFSALKRKFGDNIRSKTGTAQVNEALLKVLCHNVVCLIHEMHATGVSRCSRRCSVVLRVRMSRDVTGRRVFVLAPHHHQHDNGAHNHNGGGEHGHPE